MTVELPWHLLLFEYGVSGVLVVAFSSLLLFSVNFIKAAVPVLSVYVVSLDNWNIDNFVTVIPLFWQPVLSLFGYVIPIIGLILLIFYIFALLSDQDTDWIGLLHLINFYKSRRFDPKINLPR